MAMATRSNRRHVSLIRSRNGAESAEPRTFADLMTAGGVNGKLMVCN
jgi:hypothetical protein